MLILSLQFSPADLANPDYDPEIGEQYYETKNNRIF
jgi:hypothetical protein